tara:strand:- start:141 stop:620 length:480 start_codon:yes stop_codon:yes gene_type:complete
MAKVGRAARVASKQRTETLGNGTSAGTDKVIKDAETGELYLIDHNHASALTISLPAVADGAYFRFQLITQLSANGTIVIQDHADASAGTMKGTVLNVVYAGSSADTTIATNKDAGSATKFTINDDTHVGSYVECFSDGTSWHVSGVCITSALSNCVFDA